MNQRPIYQLPTSQKEETPPWVRLGYRLAMGLMVLGVVVVGIAGGSVFNTVRQGTQQIQLPGSVTVKLKSGFYVGLPGPKETVFPGGLSVSVTDNVTGERIPVQTGADTAFVVATGPQGTRPLFQFETFDAGTYTLEGTAPVMGGSLSVLLLHESLGRTRSDLVVGVLAGVLLIGVGVFFFFHTRRRQKKRSAVGTISTPDR